MKKSLAVSQSCIPDPTSRSRTERVRFFRTPRRQRFLDLRFLLAKARYETEKFSECDFQTLFETLDYLVENRDKFRFKRGELLFLLQEHNQLLYSVKRVCLDKSLPVEQLFWRLRRHNADILLDSHAYFGLKNKEYQRNVPSVFFKDVKLVRPLLRYVGVGYKDKGSSREDSFAGIPSIKEHLADNQFRKRMMISPEYSVDDPPEIFGGEFSSRIITI